MGKNLAEAFFIGTNNATKQSNAQIQFQRQLENGLESVSCAAKSCTAADLNQSTTIW